MAVDLSNILTQIKSVLDAANTTTATHFLSNGLNNPVKKILKVNPDRIPPQASFYPFVTCYVDKKDIELTTIAKDQLVAKRAADIYVKLLGGVWETTVPEVTEDEADEQISILMENVEQNLRANHKLNNAVNWSVTESVEYHAYPRLEEDAHLRVGVLSLRCRVDY